MENPAAEITPIIHLLCQSPPTLQKQTLEKYFVREAAFIHPFCRTGAFDLQFNLNLGPLGNSNDYTNSRFLILAIFRWYKILSPKIELEVDSVAFDSDNLILYITLHQLFRIFLLPRSLAAKVQLVTKLTLRRSTDGGETSSSNEGSKYYITEQNDLYQVGQFIRFIDPLRILWIAVLIWHFIATLACVAGQWVLAPVSWWEDTRVGRNLESGDEIERRERKSDVDKVD